MGLPTIDFHREALGLPVGVDLPPLHLAVELRQRHSHLLERIEEEELGTGTVEDRLAVEVERFPQAFGSDGSVASGQNSIEGVEVQATEAAGPIDRPRQLA